MSGNLISADLKLAGRLDARFFALLQALQDTGSINKAARTAGLSYKGAWLLLESACNLSNEPLLETATGGAGGGGTRLTPAALGLLDAWRTLQADQREFLRQQEARLSQLPALSGLLRRMSMKTTARNQFAGRIKAVEIGPVSAQATIELKSGDLITATMTAAAATRLKLKKGKEAIALIKASAVVLVTDFAGWQLSARHGVAHRTRRRVVAGDRHAARRRRGQRQRHQRRRRGAGSQGRHRGHGGVQGLFGDGGRAALSDRPRQRPCHHPAAKPKRRQG